MDKVLNNGENSTTLTIDVEQERVQQVQQGASVLRQQSTDNSNGVADELVEQQQQQQPVINVADGDRADELLIQQKKREEGQQPAETLESKLEIAPESAQKNAEQNTIFTLNVGGTVNANETLVNLDGNDENKSEQLSRESSVNKDSKEELPNDLDDDLVSLNNKMLRRGSNLSDTISNSNFPGKDQSFQKPYNNLAIPMNQDNLMEEIFLKLSQMNESLSGLRNENKLLRREVATLKETSKIVMDSKDITVDYINANGTMVTIEYCGSNNEDIYQEEWHGLFYDGKFYFVASNDQVAHIKLEVITVITEKVLSIGADGRPVLVDYKSLVEKEKDEEAQSVKSAEAQSDNKTPLQEAKERYTKIENEITKLSKKDGTIAMLKRDIQALETKLKKNPKDYEKTNKTLEAKKTQLEFANVALGRAKEDLKRAKHSVETETKRAKEDRERQNAMSNPRSSFALFGGCGSSKSAKSKPDNQDAPFGQGGHVDTELRGLNEANDLKQIQDPDSPDSNINYGDGLVSQRNVGAGISRGESNSRKFNYQPPKSTNTSDKIK